MSYLAHHEWHSVDSATQAGRVTTARSGTFIPLSLTDLPEPVAGSGRTSNSRRISSPLSLWLYGYTTVAALGILPR